MKTTRPVEPKRTAWWWLRPALLVLVPLLMAVGCIHTSRTTHEICAVCYSSLSVDVGGFGTDPYAPWWETGRNEDLRPSAACRDFFDGACPHRWEPFSVHATVFFFVSSAGGTRPQQPLASEYENNSRFRSLVEKRISSGALARADFRDACGIPASPTPADLADPGRRRLITLGVALLKDGGERNSWRPWERALAGEAIAPSAKGPSPR